MPLMKWYIPPILIFFAYIALHDISRFFKVFSAKPLGKAVIAVIFAAFSNLAYSIAGQMVNQVIQVTPTSFVHTVLFIAILTIPLLIILAAGIIFFICTMLSVLIMIPFMIRIPPSFKRWLFAGTLPDSKVPYALATRIFQVIFYMSIAALIANSEPKIKKWYESEISQWILGLIYNFDMYYGKECKLAPDYKLAPLGNSKFLVAKKFSSGEISFEPPIKCEE